jgi:hypothetical protein
METGETHCEIIANTMPRSLYERSANPALILEEEARPGDTRARARHFKRS